MKKIHAFIVFSLITFVFQAQSYKKLSEEAGIEADKGNYTKAIELSGKAIDLAIKDKKGMIKHEIIEV